MVDNNFVGVVAWAWLQAGVIAPKTKLSCPVVLAYLPVSSPTHSTVPLSPLGTENQPN